MFRYEIQPSTRGLGVFVPHAELGITFHSYSHPFLEHCAICDFLREGMLKQTRERRAVRRETLWFEAMTRPDTGRLRVGQQPA